MVNGNKGESQVQAFTLILYGIHGGKHFLREKVPNILGIEKDIIERKSVLGRWFILKTG